MTCDRIITSPEILRGKRTMMSKLIISALGLCISGALSTTLASTPTTTNQQITKRIDYLQAQINKLRTQQKKERQKKSYKYRLSPLSIGPYLHKTPAFDGSDLVINIPSVREDVRLLLLQHQLEKECRALGVPPLPKMPRVVFSGKLEGQTSYGSTYAGSRNANINFSGAEFDTYVQANPWVSGYMALDYDPDELLNGSRVFMNRAFIMIGNLSQFPFYLSVGQVYVPFGRYSSMMITIPMTQALGRTRARAITLGYQQTGNNALHAELYGYQSLTNNFYHSNHNNQWGTDVGYEFSNGDRVSGEIGASFISNLADSQGMQAMAFLDDETLRHRVPAMGVYGSLAIKPVVFIVEYVNALKIFDIHDVNFANRGARPSAFHAEANYMFKTGPKPSSIGIAYGHTTQALAVALPQDRYSVFYNVNIWKDTNFALEYRHDVNYTRNAISTITNPTTDKIVAGLGKSENVVTAQFDLYF
ncbi:LbtU family siderophore porin [Coxiella endosymbiont of Ornithodoros amblus]|uniref:LbtU family siderophore porin n=1 Tax=Coxiella endosymbiont of Ornithodoros amblus TaxID=1656166 RepID=UPI00244D9EEF|nr:LbtU family siderophore porin [Coxiella endosymbiont of Ornithodoros amblus]MBW5803075.1 LbtU family siderophore porin [Coxiella endosymbiont of Ornithodoros amblus]